MRIRWLAVLTLVAALCGPATAWAATGWHGEPMPDGLERSDVEGEYRWKKDGAIMVYVPRGPFTMGSNEGHRDESPAREVFLDSYYIDKHEVSWGQWRAAGMPLPRDINGKPILDTKPFWGRADDLPVSYMTWTNATDYAAWAGKRLPSEAEWEKAARGTDGRRFPWGNDEPTFERAVWKDHPIGKEQPAPVDCCAAGASPYGALNMAGNVFEWVEDVYDRGFYASAPGPNPVNRGEGRHRVLRGGAFVLEIEDLSTTLRNRQYPEEGQDYVGFRTAVSGVEPDTP